MALAVTVHGFLTYDDSQTAGRWAAQEIATETGIEELIYTVPSNARHQIVAISVTNKDTVAADNVSIAITSDTTPNEFEYIEYANALVPSGVLERTQLMLGPSDKIYVRWGAAGTYSAVPDVTDVDEGDPVTYTVTTTNVSDGTVLYWEVSSPDDFAVDTGNFTINSNTGSFSVTPSADTLTEGTETFTVTIRLGAADGPVVTTTPSVTINDTSFGATYALSTDAIGGTVNEGDTLVVTLTTQNVSDGTNIPYTVTGIQGGDLDIGSLTGNFTQASGVGTATFQFSEDVVTEGSETFTLTLDVQGDSIQVVVADTSTGPTYALSPQTTDVDEGSTLTIDVTTTNVPDSTVLYWTIESNAGDFTTSSGSVTITSNTASFGVTPDSDATTEGGESFTVALRTGSITGTIVDTTDPLSINDTSQAPAFTPDYTLAVTDPNVPNHYTLNGTDALGSISGDDPALQFDAGDTVRFSVNASGHPFYIKTAPGTGTGDQAGGADNNGAEVGNVDWTIPGTGTYYYQCSAHVNMVGTITVV
jgi:hypothetical protein